MILQPKY